jgi:hypothetical protein
MDGNRICVGGRAQAEMQPRVAGRLKTRVAADLSNLRQTARLHLHAGAKTITARSGADRFDTEPMRDLGLIAKQQSRHCGFGIPLQKQGLTQIVGGVRFCGSTSTLFSSVRLLISILPPPADNAPADNELKDCRANAEQFFFVFGDGFIGCGPDLHKRSRGDNGRAECSGPVAARSGVAIQQFIVRVNYDSRG